MFSFNKNNKKPQKKEDNTSQFNPVDVHTLPARFLPSVSSGSKISGKKNSNIITIILITIFVLVLVGAVVVWIFFNQKTEADSNSEQIDITPIGITEENVDVEKLEDNNSDVLITTPPQPIIYVSKNEDGGVSGILTLQLSANDRDVMSEIEINSNDALSDSQYIIGKSYTIFPRGKELEGKAKITIEYFDTKISSSLENSLRIAFLSSTGEWQLDDRTEIDLSRNQVSLDIVQFPSTQVAIVSNLTESEINKDDDQTVPEGIVFDIETLKPSFDADEDGLTDVEELLFGTDINKPDSDLDGYTDGEEVVNLYSPFEKNISLVDSGQFTIYNNDVFGYSLQYPSSWTVNQIDPESNIVMFNSVTNQFIEVVVEKLDSEIKTIKDWYISQVPGLSEEDMRETSIGIDDYDAIQSIDGTTVYFIADGFVVGIVYNKGIETEADYLAIYEAVKNSFSWPAVESPEFLTEDL